MPQLTIEVEGMMCAHCVAAVDAALKEVPGVTVTGVRLGSATLSYDPALANGFASAEDIAAGRISQIWDLFAATGGMPLSILRGENSDLLSAATVAEMQLRNPGLEATVIARRGHAPFLDEPGSKAAIQRWLKRVDANA